MDETSFSTEVNQHTKSNEEDLKVNSMENIPEPRSNSIATCETDIDYCNLYWTAVADLLNAKEDKKNIKNLKRCISLFKTSYDDSGKEVTNTSSCTNGNYMGALEDTHCVKMTYIYRNSAILSSAVAFHLQNVLMDNSSVCQGLLQKKIVNICSLGCGPASDVVAVVSVLDSMAKKNYVELDFHVTVIDVDHQWETTCIAVLSSLKQFRNATSKISFVAEDLSEALTSNSIEVIQKADIVTVVKLISELNHQDKHLQKAVKNVTKFIKSEALLFLLDCSNVQLIKSCGGYFGSVKNFKLVYQELNDLHALQADAVELSLKHWTQFLGLKLCSKGCHQFAFENNIDVFVRVWLRSTSGKHKQTPRKFEFRQNREQYTAKESFLDSNSFETWENNFRRSQSLLGWSEDDIGKVIQSRKHDKNEFQFQWNNQKKLVESARKQLVQKRIKVEDENSSQVEEVWLNYFKEKETLTLLKKKVCRLSSYQLRRHLEVQDFLNETKYIQKNKSVAVAITTYTIDTGLASSNNYQLLKPIPLPDNSGTLFHFIATNNSEGLLIRKKLNVDKNIL